MELATIVQGTGYPILCIHGHPGSAACLSVFSDRLCQHFQTITPDLRGYGTNPPVPPFTMVDHLADLQELLDRHKIATCLVLGWSLGGILALELALAQPERIQGLILVGTAAQPRSDHPPITWQDNVYTAIAALLNGVFPDWPWNIRTFGRRSLYRHMVRRHTSATYRYLARYGTPAYWQTSRHAQQALNQALRSNYDRRPDLPQIQCPALVLAAAYDRHITPQASQETAQGLPHSTWRLYENTAHLFPWEIPDVVLQDIETWLSQLDTIPHNNKDLWLHVISVEYLGDYQLRLAFNNGIAGIVDLEQELYGEVFEPLRDKALFQQVFVTSRTIEWPNGADFAPEFLLELAYDKQPNQFA